MQPGSKKNDCVATDNNTLLVECGNGGDYEFERDRIAWVVWILKNLATKNFRVYAISGIPGDKALITFDDPVHTSFFRLAAPQFPEFPSLVEQSKYLHGVDAMLAYR